MSTKVRRFAIGTGSVILLLVVIFAAVGPLIARQSFPQIDGEITLAGLDGPVDVFRDSLGVPHIYATTAHDLFMAEGYIHAQDRFWQMDVWRHIGSGRLSEMFGAAQLDKDKFLRTLGWARVAQEELDTLLPEELAVLEDYSAGVNAYLAEHSGTKLSLEYGVLGLLTPSYKPEPWQPLHTLTWAKVMAYDLGKSRLSSEITHAILSKELTPQQHADLYPAYPAENPYIVNDFTLGSAVPAPIVAQLPASDELANLFASISARQAHLDALLGPGGEAIGSNNWTISGKLTASGKPILANDMHLDQQIPSIWYQVSLHCKPVTTACPYDETGFSFAGVPGVVVGHNNRIAWAMTNVGPDVIDLYIEKINPDNPNQYEVNGQWVDMKIITETLNVGGGDPVELAVRYTRNGPIISDTYGSLRQTVDPAKPDQKTFTELSGISLPEHYAISMRWTALEPNDMITAVLGLNRAQNWDEFRAAASEFAVPAQNLVYADVDGNIGYQLPGSIPMRKPGHDGTLPVPGWNDDYQWLGYIPFEEHPFTFNPASGYVVTANNATIGLDYPYLITKEFDLGYRARRITDLIENAPAPITVDYVKSIQGDNFDASAAFLVPALLQVDLGDAHLADVRGLLDDWEYQNHMDSASAALYNAYWYHLLADTFRDDLSKNYWPAGNARWIVVVNNLMQQPDSTWWDDKTTSDKVETFIDIERRAFAEAVTELEQRFGKDTAKWNWGDMHTLTFTNTTLGDSGVAPIEALFNRGPFRTSGGDAIVNATGWNASLDTNVYAVESLPSERVIYDLADFKNSVAIHTTGQSGHAYHAHYIDMADLWRNIQYSPMLWGEQAIVDSAEGHLVLKP